METKHSTVHEFEGYLLFNDEADGYRLCWLQLGGHHETEEASLVCSSFAYVKGTKSSRFRFTARANVISIPIDVEWELVTGSPTEIVNEGTGSVELSVVLMAYLHIDILLIDILGRLRGSSFPVRCLPSFCYNLVSVEAGRTVELVIVFQDIDYIGAGTEAPKALGVFVLFDLVDQSYEELEWVQSMRVFDDLSLSHWCIALSLSRRAKAVHGDGSAPFYVNYVRNVEKILLTQGGRGNEDDTASPILSWLYPFCDHYSNEAVIEMKPLGMLRCTGSPTELHYG